MIYQGTILNVSDNSGAKKVSCIRLLNNRRQYGKIGDIIKVSVKNCLPNCKVKKKDMYHALIVKTKYGFWNENGFYSRFSCNSVILLSDRLEMIGTRVFGVIPRFFKNTCFKRLVSLSKFVI